ncbi:TonB-dependent receptor [Undibacterium sp. KW1]|uniref:TonB-dependent receptor n=1 Tax=Undibacterium sp. KW1 TaxID=2058624 RepID=UPI0013894E8A|nr:TonB-dependent receptor [Undibacterium sp. KW1]
MKPPPQNPAPPSTSNDNYSAVTNTANFDEQGKPIASATQGNKADKLTYKLSAAYRAFDNLLLRASYGTGFKMASMSDITSPLTHSGNTGGTYPCPVRITSDQS